MDVGLYDIYDSIITPYVNVIPKSDVVKIENRLLDGSFHIQTIGDAASLLKVTLQARDETVRERVCLAETTGEEVKIIYNSKYWKGLIRDTLDWDKTAGVFSTSFEFLVTDTGLL